jgi:hypothetical protein
MLTHGRAGAAAPMTPATIYIDPDAPAGGDGSIAAPFNSWNVGALQAGTRYLQRAGTTASGLIAVTTAATAALPIVIGAYGSGKAPMFDGMVDFSGASHVTLTGFTLTSASGAAVIIQQGSSNIEVSGNAGVWIGNGMGSHIAILHNTISGAAGNGIAVSGPSISAQPDIAIARNIISGSGADGIQISSNGIEVSGNSISASGLSTTGASGIQVYAGSATAGVGQGNIITGNVLVGNRDATGQVSCSINGRAATRSARISPAATMVPASCCMIQARTPSQAMWWATMRRIAAAHTAYMPIFPSTTPSA